MPTKSAIIELVYNALCNQVNAFQQQKKLTNEDIENILIRILQNVKDMRLIEASDTILKLTQQVEELEKKGGENDKSND